MIPTTRRVTVNHKGSPLQARVKRCVENSSNMSVYQLELVKTADEREQFANQQGNSVVATENYIIPPLPLNGDLVMVKSEPFYILALPPTPIPTAPVRLGELRVERVMHTQLQHLRFPTFDEELLCICTYMTEEDIEHFLLSWEIDLIHKLLHSDTRIHTKLIGTRTQAWSVRTTKTLKTVIEKIVNTQAPSDLIS